MVVLPAGVSRHSVRFLNSAGGVCAVKELPLELARREYSALRQLEELEGPSVLPVGIVQRTGADPGSELAAAVITRYAQHAFPYRQLLSGPGFGARRNQMLDAFALLLVQLHLKGCYWGDCSLSNVLCRYDAAAIETIMVDAETTSLHPSLSDGQRGSDLGIMVENVGGEMADIAAAAGLGLDEADLGMGEDIADRYRSLWSELSAEETIDPGEEYRVTERVRRLNDLGFQVDEIEVVPHRGREHLHFKVRVAGHGYNTDRLKELTGLEAGEFQARQLLADLNYFARKQGEGSVRTPAGKALMALRWRAEALEPTLARLAPHLDGRDPIQAYCDLLNHRYLVSAAQGRDVGTEAALKSWLKEGMPGYTLT
ncbi:MAG TPA: DUF4032 domain-containing protein [Candidatus Acidoferrales bacterium]|nr:DUF4032 domain-containing protein [Candidatus Acidoferrales bacterium]